MLKNLNTSLTTAAFVLIFGSVSFSYAQAQDENSSFDYEAAAPALAPADEFSSFTFDEAAIIDSNSLDEMRGTALSPEILGIAIFDGVSANNISNGTVSGGNIIDANAFSDSSGLSTIIQNSGNNVVIQSATILNVAID